MPFPTGAGTVCFSAWTPLASIVTGWPATLAPSTSSEDTVCGLASSGPSVVSDRVVTEAIRSAPSPTEMPVLIDSATARTTPWSSRTVDVVDRVPETPLVPWKSPVARAAPSAALAVSE